jgi:hypothetical protein
MDTFLFRMTSKSGETFSVFGDSMDDGMNDRDGGVDIRCSRWYPLFFVQHRIMVMVIAIVNHTHTIAYHASPCHHHNGFRWIIINRPITI